MKSVLISAPYILPEITRFQEVFEFFNLEILLPDVHERLSENELMSYAGTFDGTICGDDQYTSKVIDACSPRLKVISKWGTGIDSIDQTAADEKGIFIGNTTNAFTVPVSESVLGYMLAFVRQLPWLDWDVKAGRWEKIIGKTLSECILGVVGVGNIGKAVLRRASAFGMQLIGNDIIDIAPDFLLEHNVQMTPLDDMMARSDFISINCTLNPTSYHLINAERLALCKPDAVVINTARGPVINETDLIQALQSGKIGGAALDVFEVEPLPADSPLRNMPQVMLAPHNSNSSPRFWEDVHWNTIRNLLIGLNIDIEKLSDLKEKFAK